MSRAPTNLTNKPHRLGRSATALLALLLLVGQWQGSWHAMLHLTGPDAVSGYDADGTDNGTGHSTAHCDHFTPAQLALPAAQTTLPSAAPVAHWHAAPARTRHNLAGPGAFQPRAPPFSA